MALQQFHEVAVFGHYHDASGFRGSKDVWVFRIPKAKVANGVRIEFEAHPQPHCNHWRKLRIEPEDHATTTG